MCVCAHVSVFVCVCGRGILEMDFLFYSKLFLRVCACMWLCACVCVYAHLSL